MTQLIMAMIMKIILVKSKMLQSMKRIISNVMLVAVAAAAFFSCQKQEVNAPETEPVTCLTFTSEKPAFADETKTEWTGETIQWSQGDKISIAYTVDGNWQNASGDASGDAKLYKSSELETATEVAKFNVSGNFKGTTAGVHIFYGVYPAPSEPDFSNAPVATLTIPNIQTPLANSFDAAGDLMVGVSEEYDSCPESGETISLKWNRLVAHAVITLKEINGFIAGETLTGITLTAQKGANLVGKHNVDLTTGAVENNDGASNIIKIAPGSLSVDANGTVTFWVCVLPETLTSLTVEVDTDQATYTREITGISKTFKQNARNTLAVDMSLATRVTKETESWVLVTPADGITEGTYALVASTSTKTGVLVSTNGSSSAPAFNTGITVEDKVLKGVAEAMQFDIVGTAGNYEIYVAGGTSKWLYCTSNNNGVRVGTNTNKTWTISAHNKNINAFIFKHNATNRYLGVYNNQDWRCYDALTKLDDVTGNTGAIYLYKKTSGPVAPDTTPKIIVSETTKDVVFDGETVTFNYELKYLDGEELTYAVSNESMISSVTSEDGVLTVTVAKNVGEARTATITLSCGDAEDVVLTINQAKYVDTSDPDAGELVKYTLLFGANYNSGKISAYDKTWSATNNGFQCNLANWNNNNNDWSYVKAGSKKYASVATITTAAAVPEALTTVTMTVDDVTSSKINSLKLYVSSDANFTSKDTYNATAAVGDVVFNISEPVANAYYKIEVDCQKGKSNGLITVSKVVYAN